MSTPTETSPELDWSPCRHADSGSAVCRYCAPQRYERLIESLRAAIAALQAENAELRERLEAAELEAKALDGELDDVKQDRNSARAGMDDAIAEAREWEEQFDEEKARATAAEGERDDYKFQLESVISERPHWDELDRKLTNLAGGLEGTALAIAEARRREAEGERDRLREALERARVEFKRIAELARVSGWPVMAATAEKAATRAIPHAEGEASE